MEKKFTIWALTIIDTQDKYNDYVTDQTLFNSKASAIKSAVATMKLYMNWKPYDCEEDYRHLKDLVTELVKNERYYYDGVIVKLKKMNVWGD